MSAAGNVRRAFARAANGYDRAAGMQRKVCDRLIAGLPRRAATRVLDLGCGTGFAAGALAALYPRAQCVAADFAAGMLDCHAQPHCWRRVCADAHRLPFADATFDVVVSSLMLQWCDLQTALGEMHRVLATGGTLAFSTVLQGSLHEIDLAFQGLDACRHTVMFHTASSIERAVRATGFADVRMTFERHVEHFDEAHALLHSNRNIGASRVPEGARRAMLGRTAMRRVTDRINALRTAQGLPLTYELAWLYATA